MSENQNDECGPSRWDSFMAFLTIILLGIVIGVVIVDTLMAIYS